MLSLSLAAHEPPCGPSSGPSSPGRVRGLPPVPGTWPSWPRAGNGRHARWTKPRLACSQLVDEFGALPSSPPASPLPRARGKCDFSSLPRILSSPGRGEAFGTQAYAGVVE